MVSKCFGQKAHRVFLFPGSWPELVSWHCLTAVQVTKYNPPCSEKRGNRFGQVLESSTMGSDSRGAKMLPETLQLALPGCWKKNEHSQKKLPRKGSVPSGPPEMRR